MWLVPNHKLATFSNDEPSALPVSRWFPGLFRSGSQAGCRHPSGFGPTRRAGKRSPKTLPRSCAGSFFSCSSSSKISCSGLLKRKAPLKERGFKKREQQRDPAEIHLSDGATVGAETRNPQHSWVSWRAKKFKQHSSRSQRNFANLNVEIAIKTHQLIYNLVRDGDESGGELNAQGCCTSTIEDQF